MTEKNSPTRRQFLAAAAPAAAAAAVLRPADLAAQAAASIPSLRIPSEIPAALGEAPVAPAFEGNGMMGADVFAKLCKDEGLAAMFCCPGNYTVTHAIAAAGIPSYGGRTEGTMAAAADGYARATGEVVACSGTEGPGFTNMITSIASAYYARIPLLVLASNVQLTSEDRETGIQAMYQQPITEGIKKYGKRMILPNRVHEYGAYAFRQLKTGVPGPGASRLSRRGGAPALQGPRPVDRLLRSLQVPHRVARRAVSRRRREGGGPHRQGRAAAAHRRPRRVPSQGVGAAGDRGGEERHRGGDERSDAGPFPRRSSAVREPLAARVHERRPDRLRRPVLDAEPERISRQPRRQGHPRPSGRRRSGTQLAARARRGRRRARVPRGARQRAAAPQPRDVGIRGRGRSKDLRRRAGAQSPERREVERRHPARCIHRSSARSCTTSFTRARSIPSRRSAAGADSPGSGPPCRSCAPIVPGRKSSARTSSARSVPTWR